MTALLSGVENCRPLGRFRPSIVLGFILAIPLLAGSVETGQFPLLSPATTSAAEATAFDSVAKRIEMSVGELGYPKDVAQDFVRLVRDWNCDAWHQTLSQARQKYQQKQMSASDVARVEEEVTQRLADTISRKVVACDQDENKKYFYLSAVVKDKKAQCLGYCQLVYILGNSIGLRVTAIGVLELASGPSLAEHGHAACCVELSDGKVSMVDVGNRLLSKPFVFLDVYRAASNCWELKQTDNPLRLHRRIQILDRNGIVAAVYNSLGSVYYAAGNPTQAFSFYTKAIELNPKYVEAYSNRGIAYGKSDQLVNAISDFTKAIELDPKYADAYSNRGFAYDKASQPAKAIPDYNKAIELNPKYLTAYINRGVANAKVGKATDAKKDLQKAVELNPALKGQVKNISDQFKLGL